MAFEIHENISVSKSTVPYLLNIQHDLCRILNTRIIVPLVAEKPVTAINELVVPCEVCGETFYAVTSHIAAVSTDRLGSVVGTLSAPDAIRQAVDRLFIGY